MGGSRRSPELLLTILALAAGAALLLVALGVTDGRAAGVDLAQAAVPAAAPADPPPAAARTRSRPEIGLPQDGTPILTVRDGAEVAMRDAPGGQVVTALTDTTEFDSPTVLSVAERRGNWAGVPTAELPNGKLGWVKLDSDGIKIDSVGQSIVLDLSSMTGKLYRGSDLERKWQIGIGAPATPTPTGRFSITDEIVGGLNPTYGCCAIALSATQPNLPAGWTGGDRIAIHGTSLPLGAANSTGCAHSGEDDLRALIDGVPLGTPVTIEN
jgi:lipoprotein-anchoring transpeptidase ErfK/SrfK